MGRGSFGPGGLAKPRHTCGGVESLDLGALGGDRKLAGGVVEPPTATKLLPRASHIRSPRGVGMSGEAAQALVLGLYTSTEDSVSL